MLDCDSQPMMLIFVEATGIRKMTQVVNGGAAGASSRHRKSARTCRLRLSVRKKEISGPMRRCERLFRSLAPALSVWAVALGATGLFNDAAAEPAGDARDAPYIAGVLNEVLERQRTNVEVPWTNPETGNRGLIVVERTFYRDPRTPCREYRRSVQWEGASERWLRGTGCRVGTALWTVEESAVSASPPASSAAAPAAPAAAPAPPPSPPARTAGAGAAESEPPRRRAAERPPPAAPRSAPEDARKTKPEEKQPKMPEYTLPSKTVP